jgi:phosphoribosylamine--glycine ligase
VRILVLGSGAREHAILWKLNQSSEHSLFVCPGNIGMDKLATRLSVQDRYSMEEYAALALEHSIDLTVVGPENYLVNGIVDLFHARGLRIFGPTAAAARLEGSKVWAKEIMQAVGIPTASWRSFTDYREARLRAEELDWSCVIKADGLAAGKGAFVCHSKSEVVNALGALSRMTGDSSAVILVEELLHGPELSVFAISDGRTVLPFGAAQDHKRLENENKGPNTGGMGAYSPVNHMLVAQGFADSFFQPLVTSLRARGIEYVGVLYAGAIVTDEGPKILEFNCRFGDPEAEVLLRRLEGDLASLLTAATKHSLHTVPEPKWSSQEALCVVAASRLYPKENDFGSPISGIDAAEHIPGVIVFHAGTEGDPGANQIITNGGRILCVTAIGEKLSIAHKRAYDALSKISFKGMQYRTDIGTQALPEAWRTRWRKSPRWEQQMRVVTDGLDSLASAVQRLQLGDLGDTDRDRDKALQDIRQRLYALKLQTMLPGELGAGLGLQVTWTLFAKYVEMLNASSPGQIATNDAQVDPHESDGGRDAFGAATEMSPGSQHSAAPRLEVLNLPLSRSILRFERHDDYDMLAWASRLTAADTIEWLEKQRDTASAFYVDSKSFTYEFERQDIDIVGMISESEDLSEIRSVRFETSSYTCIWSTANSDLGEVDPTFAILSPTLLVDDVWWFMKGTSDERAAEEMRRVLDALQDLATDAPHLLSSAG